MASLDTTVDTQKDPETAANEFWARMNALEDEERKREEEEKKQWAARMSKLLKETENHLDEIPDCD